MKHLRFTSKIFIVCRERQGQERIAQMGITLHPIQEKISQKSINGEGRYELNCIPKVNEKGNADKKFCKENKKIAEQKPCSAIII